MISHFKIYIKSKDFFLKLINVINLAKLIKIFNLLIQGFLLHFIQIYLKLVIIIIIIIIIKHLTDDTHKYSNKNLHNLF